MWPDVQRLALTATAWRLASAVGCRSRGGAATGADARSQVSNGGGTKAQRKQVRAGIRALRGVRRSVRYLREERDDWRAAGLDDPGFDVRPRKARR